MPPDCGTADRDMKIAMIEVIVVGIPFAGLLATWFSSAQIATLERQTIKLQRNRARIQKERRDRDSYDVR